MMSCALGFLTLPTSHPYMRAGKCVPFDWVCFSAMLLFGRAASSAGGISLMTTERRELYVGEDDASILVLVAPGELHHLLVVKGRGRGLSTHSKRQVGYGVLYANYCTVCVYAGGAFFV